MTESKCCPFCQVELFLPVERGIGNLKLDVLAQVIYTHLAGKPFEDSITSTGNQGFPILIMGFVEVTVLEPGPLTYPDRQERRQGRCEPAHAHKRMAHRAGCGF